MKGILYLTFSYPPGTGVSKNRSLKITQGLIKNGYYPIVITSLNPSDIKKDYFRIISKNDKIKIIRVPYLHFIETIQKKLSIPDFFIPDSTIEWILFAIPLIILFVKRKKIDIIYATAPTFSALLLGLICKIILKKPLVIMYRDPWSNNPYCHNNIFNHNKTFSKLQHKLEKYILRNSNKQIFISKALKKNIINQYQELNLENSSYVVPSAIDMDDYKNIKKKKNNPKKLSLVSTLSIYGRRNPKEIFSLIKEAKELKIINAENFKYHIYGKCNSKIILNQLKEKKITNEVILHGYKPLDVCFEAQVNADLLVDISEKKIDYPTFPYHFWEYFAAGKKILYFGREMTFKSNFIKKNHLGYILPLNKPIELRKRFFKLLKDFYENKLITNNTITDDFISKNSWDERIKVIVQILKI